MGYGFDIYMQMFTSIECDACFKNNIDELGLIFQFDLKSHSILFPECST